MARRLNDKRIQNVADTFTTTAKSAVIYLADNNAATTDRFIFSGSITGISAVDPVTVSCGVLVLHVKGDTVGVTSMVLTNGAQMWPDDGSVLYQGMFNLSGDETAPGIDLQIDVKGKRKLSIGDSLKLVWKADRSSTTSLVGAMTVFAKLA